MHANLRSFIEQLRRENDVVEIHAEVDPYLEIPEIHRRVIEAQGKALLFTNVKGSKFPVIINLFGTNKRIELAFTTKPLQLVKTATEMIDILLPPKPKELWKYRGMALEALKLGTKMTRNAPVLESRQSEVNLNEIPMLTGWQEDGGAFVTLPLVYTESPVSGKHNLGMYRIQRHDAKTTGMHWQIHKGGGFHYHEAEKMNQSLPVNLFVGGPPALILSAIAPLPEDVPELVLASVLAGGKIKTAKNPMPGRLRLIAEAEFAIVGTVPPHERRPEGPFGDHYGYYSLQHDYPVFNVDAVFHRKDAIYPATVVGKPRQEDFYIGDYLQELLSPLFPIVMPAVRDLWSYGETGFHSLAAAVVRERYAREALGSAFRILGEGQLSLTKFLMLTDTPQDLRDFKKLFEHILERVDWARDFFIFAETSYDTLDYASGKINHGSKAVLMGLGEKKRDLPHEFRGEIPPQVKQAEMFCGGCLVLETESYESQPDLAEQLAKMDVFKDMQVVVLHDSIEYARSTDKFLWATWTRFNPATDVVASETAVRNHHLAYSAPIFIDARMKPWYPAELNVDEDTKKLVDSRWGEYFPE